ncbi:lysosomal alpha-glucosidase [Patella vulgata]|uniref:lysosomal alpha-glucosidase n=1 Tax=Patella vulgata TaxID=6465 RepID=UPI00217F6137|nr:lysosomal alpha-glucosidase [Patella vulgata]XP_050393604.1 lysosomal alpha-glucosidase [Patella vulgata]XP_050393605.1 lysosomal alpha-glucosidase [Patella vulgata]XP_055955046.1 lysosomal alpha-glucosidase [Patella vulgata]
MEKKIVNPSVVKDMEIIYIPVKKQKQQNFHCIEVFLLLMVFVTCLSILNPNFIDKIFSYCSMKTKNKVDLSAADTCTIDRSSRFDCYPEKSLPTQSECDSRKCCYDAQDTGGDPVCFYPTNYEGYLVTSKIETSTGINIMLNRTTQSFQPKDVNQLIMEITYETPTRLRIRVTNSDPNVKRWEVPLNINSDKTGPGQRPLYKVNVSDVGSLFSFTVNRTATDSSNTVNLLKTGGAFIFADQFLQLSYFLPSNYIYGLGEHRDTLLHSMNWTRFTMWNRDHYPSENTNIYGDHPFYLSIENGGNCHGVFLLNSNAMEVLLQPAPAITWRTIGGVIDLYMFLGPSPNDVIEQYTEVIGRTFMPPYWSLGFHVCRWGYLTANGTLKVVDRIRDYGIPQDTQWNDIEYSEGMRDYTTGFSTFGNQTSLVEELHSRGMHYMMIVDPGISNTAGPGKYYSYDLGVKLDVFIKNVSSLPLVGVVWPGPVVFTDFTHPKSQEYWTAIAADFHKSVPFDGMWIDMNEISNFVNGSMTGCPYDSPLEKPPYIPNVAGRYLSYNTICVSAQQYISTQYNLHTLYGLMETKASKQALESIRGKRSFVISRSSFPGQGHYGGHWTGDNGAGYYDMYKSISEILSMNMFGITMVGADICGFRGNTNEQLCQRWHQLGAFYTFSRNHNDRHNRPQDPGAFGPALAESTRKVYLIRYSLLPYLYTLIYNSYMMGDTVLRPLFFEYPTVVDTYSIDRQFLWGPALLISPALDQDQYTVEAYIPVGYWYDFYTGERIIGTGDKINLTTPLDKINLHIRGGYILPTQQPALTTTDSRKNKFGLLVALNSTNLAEGDLFWDDGDTLGTYYQKLFNSFIFSADKNGVYINPLFKGYEDEPMLLGNVTVFGLQQQPTRVTLNGVSTNYNYNAEYKVLYMVNISTTMMNPIQIKWLFS